MGKRKSLKQRGEEKQSSKSVRRESAQIERVKEKVFKKSSERESKRGSPQKENEKEEEKIKQNKLSHLSME